MPRVRPFSFFFARILIVMQLGCVVLGTALLLRLHDQVKRGLLLELFAVALFAGVITIAGWLMMADDHRSALKLAESMREERLLTATLEQAVASRTNQLEDAQRV